MSLLGDIIDRVLFPNRELHVIPVLDGAFSPNQRLDQGRRLGDEIERPDDIALGPDGALYVSTGNRILRCTGDDFNTRAVFATLEGPVGGLACSPDGRLLACVSGVGLVALSPVGKIVGRLESAGGERISCPLSVTVATDGAVYLTDGSRNNPPELWLTDLMQNRPPSGRLIGCDSSLGGARVSADKLAWPLGVIVSADGKEVWVAESWAHRLTAFSRAGDHRRVIVKNYSGYPARLARAADGGVWMAFLALRTQLTEFVLRERAFCEEMMRTVPSELWIGPALDGRLNPREPTQIGRIKKLGIQKPWAPPRSYGLVARLDARGVATGTLHSRVDGWVHGITTVRPIGSRVLAVSKGRDCLVELPVGRGAEEG
ncbi:SMP-30/gluconolactonase/LRE family protein [Bradyrhizobium jicamae]|uniref:SMP-30/gluconolactonase/LRE family protein n=1 Tax=Bradyrhizobium jicamae TaxID=280332 RepID=A0ABS5FWR0_9BRAD|nr:SMP-30/gluconolactonase/LRE family protein [Bradyrhizobium jicamae]MBR0801222.1 SMP-30/gluconolactonase/LRE family protein [Bradyrhizobium jicamae]